MNLTQLLPGEDITNAGSKVRLIRNGKGLAWGTDAYLLAAYLRRGRRACELGCGCGVISLLAAAHEKFEYIAAVEIREDMADLTRRNAALNGLDGKIDVYCRDLRQVDHPFIAREMGGRFDAVFSNPPYIAHPGTANSDAAADCARHEIFGGIGDFCGAAARLLNHGGAFYTVFRPERLPDLFIALRTAGLEPKKLSFICPDHLSAPSLVLVESKLGGAPGLSVAPPVFFYRDGKEITPRVMSDRMAEIYQNCSF